MPDRTDAGNNSSLPTPASLSIGGADVDGDHRIVVRLTGTRGEEIELGLSPAWAKAHFLAGLLLCDEMRKNTKPSVTDEEVA